VGGDRRENPPALAPLPMKTVARIVLSWPGVFCRRSPKE
jgi:hypothetical protein